MQKHNCEQKSDEWFVLREQYPLTASEAQAIGNQGKGLETLVWTKLSERHSIADKKRYTNTDLERGVELEPLARDIYELRTGNKVEQVGFITNDEVSKVGGASPDGLVNSDGLLEIKCFEDKKHFKATVDFKETGKFEIEPQYKWQMQMQMLFTGRDWCDFAIYNPNYRETLLVQRVVKDEEMQNDIKAGLIIGEKLINEIEQKLK